MVGVSDDISDAKLIKALYERLSKKEKKNDWQSIIHKR